jgi:hypothetical protein
MVNFDLEESEVLHSREVYHIMDLIGDLGGVFEVIITIFGIFVFPMSQHSFVMKALEKLFLARTLDNSMFVKTKLIKKNRKRKF